MYDLGNPLAAVLPLLAAILLLGSEAAGGADLTASWDDNSVGMARTKLERRTGLEADFHVIADLPPGVSFYIDTGVVAGQMYCYRAMAHSPHIESAYSEEMCGVAVDRLNLRVEKTGEGAGTVSSVPSGIACGAACSAVFPVGTAVVLSATATPGSTFVGWSGGGCVGSQTCTVAGNTVAAVTANFGPLRTSGSGGCTVAGAEAGMPYVGFCTPSAGTPPYSCTLARGVLPSGLSLGTDCRISGIPASPGTTSFVAHVTNGSGRLWNISGRASVLPRVAITTASISSAVVDRAFNTTLAATGGQRPYSWAVVDGGLPSGLTLDRARGTIAGLPSAVGVGAFKVRVRDALGATTDRALQLIVTGGALTATCTPGPAEVGVPLSGRCSARGGVPPYTCAVMNGTLPSGVMLDSDCTLRGVSAKSGTASFRARLSDTGGASVEVRSELIVQPHISVVTASLPEAVANRFFSAALAAAGGVPPYRWTLTAGELPAGVTLDSAGGRITGQTTQRGAVTAVLRVSDALGASAERSLTLVVNGGR
jgi:hypothetical protein